MAARKKPHTEPVKDNSFGEEPGRIVRELDNYVFNSIIRYILVGKTDSVHMVKNKAEATLTRLEVKPNGRKRVANPPDGSDNFDVGSVNKWMDSLTKADKVAINQLVVIHATASSRS